MSDGSPDQLTLILALWGAVLSTVLAVFGIVEFRYKLLRQLDIDATGSFEAQELSVIVQNVGQRPVAITVVEIRYGPYPPSAAVIVRDTEALPRRLEEGEIVAWSFPRGQVIELREQQSVLQRASSRLWVAIRTSRRGVQYRFIRVDEVFVPDPSYKPVNDYVAADVFLGFPPQEQKGRSARFMK